jgi:protease IV
MGKFLLGLLTGAILVVIVLVIGAFAVASLRAKPASIADGSTLILHLQGDIPESPGVDISSVSLPFLQSRTPVTVENVWSMLRHAAADSRIKAVVFEPEATSPGWAKMQEIRADLEQFRKSGKPLIAYLKAPTAREYYMASACSKIYMSPVDLLDLKGIGFELMYFKNTLDKLGVHVDVEHAGKYKDYGDMFTRTSMSPETNEVMSSLADIIYGDLVNTIAKGRNKDAAAMRAIIDNGPFLAKQAKANGLVDELRYEDEAFGELKTTLRQSELKKITEQEYVNSPALGAAKDKIAFVVADGTITRGSPGSTSVSGLESETFDKMLGRVANDSTVKGVIVRIDSPGGEVAASDDMWRAMNELHKKKPTVISMSDDAASGGYYMAMSGDPLIAYPGTLTGSIGVVFGKPNLHGLYDKLGITKDYVSRGRFALIESDYTSLTDAERAKLREGIDSDYEDFLAKVAAARRKPVSAIEPIAQGRVWLGAQAKANGLVDELGGIDRALDMVKAKAGIPSGDQVNLALYPPKRSLFDLLLHPNPDADADAMLSGVGLAPLKTAWHDASLRVWMRGGMLRMMPFTIQIR